MIKEIAATILLLKMPKRRKTYEKEEFKSNKFDNVAFGSTYGLWKNQCICGRN